MKIMVDNYAASCCFYYSAASIVMSFEMMTELCLVKRIKTEEKCKLRKHLIQSLVAPYYSVRCHRITFSKNRHFLQRNRLKIQYDPV